MTATIDFRSPEAGYDDPLAMWLACHQRVKRFAAMLGRLSAHLQRTGADEEAQRAAAAIRRYFNEAAPRHHEDEEVDMFPRLRERCAAAERATLDAVIDDIEADHLDMAGLWRQIDAILADVQLGRPATLAPELIEPFIAHYDRHIGTEEGVLMPAMQRALDAADWNAVGRAMAERRGLEWSGAAEAPIPKRG